MFNLLKRKKKDVEETMNKDLFVKFVGPVIRHGLTLFGGYLIAHGADAAGTGELLGGAGTVLTMLVWSIIEKHNLKP